MGIFYLISNALSPYQKLFANDTENIQNFDSIIDFTFYNQLSSQFVFNPFPYKTPNLVQPIDSLSSPKGLINIKFDQKSRRPRSNKILNILLPINPSIIPFMAFPTTTKRFVFLKNFSKP